MALYTERNFNDISADWEEMQRRELERQQQQAAQQYNAAQNNLSNQQEKKTGLLESVLSGIGNSIKNVGDSLYNMFGTGAASVRDIFTGNIGTGKYTKEWEQYAKKAIYGDENMSDKDYYAKTGGKALDAAATVSDLIPGLGTAAKVGLNVGQGAASGIAQNFIDNGANVSLEDVLKGAGVGAASAGVGQYVGGKLAGKTAGSSTLSKALNSNIGKAALTGAASGATGSGLSTALNGGNIGQIIGNAAQGAGGGALAGGTMAGAMGLAGAGLEKLNNKIIGTDVDQANIAKAPRVEDMAAEDGETATGWGDKNMTNAAKKRNALQKFGDTLQETGQKTQDQSVTGKLKGNTADDMANKNSIQRLRDIGFEPSDYEQAANLSEVANKWYDDQVKQSKVTLDMPDTYKIADEVAYYRRLSPDQADALKADITKRLDAARKTGGGLFTFDADGLERVAKGLGQDVEKMTTTNYGGSKKRINNLSSDAEAYANALNDVKLALRSKVDDMTDYNPETLRKVLKDAGATQKQIDYLTDAKSMAQVKRNTSLLEDARTMNRQIKSSPLKRGANADASTNFTTQAANASGLSGVLNMAAEPIGKVVGKAEKGLGKLISSAGDIVDGKTGNVAGKAANAAQDLVSALNNNTLYDASYAGYLPSFGDVMTSQIARQSGISGAKRIDDAQALREAQQQAQDAQNNYNNVVTQTQTAYANAMQPMQANTGQSQLDRIANAMELALSAGDLTAYSQLADLYQQAYKIYGAETQSTNPYSNLSSTQVENINKLDTASNAIDELEALFNQAGGGQGLLGGNFANWMGSLGLNSDVATYNALSRGLINQIGAAIGKTDSLNTEGEVNRALELIPKMTDDAQTAQNKLAQLRQMLNTNKQTVYQNYGIAQ